MLKQIQENEFEKIYAIMKEAFPRAERRPRNMQKKLLKRQDYRVLKYCENNENEIIGFFAVWDICGRLFIEHFAVLQEKRGKGTGSKALEELKEYSGKPIFLEVEEPEEIDAKRRIDFYERNGFYLSEFGYDQPPLTKGEPCVPLKLMSFPEKIDEEEFLNLKKALFKIVYQKEA